MSDGKEVGPRRAPYKTQESVAEPKQTALQRPRRRGEFDQCFQPSHRPGRRLRSSQRELRPRRAPVRYCESEDDESEDDERPPPRPGPRKRAAAAAAASVAATDRRDQTKPQPPRAAYNRAEADRRYRQQHLERIREKDRRYYETNRERILARHRRYRETHGEEVRETQRQYRERCREELNEKKRLFRKSHREEIREKMQRYRESHREELREKQRQRNARRREADPERVREQNRIRQQQYRKAHPERVMEYNRIRRLRHQEKKRGVKLMTLTIPLTDCRTSMPVVDYVQAFCDSLDSVDTPLPESQDSVDTPESFLQLLLEEGPTGLDSGTIQGSEPSDCPDLSFLQELLSPDEWERSEPSDCPDLSFLQELLSPDEWEQVMDDLQDFDGQDFNMEAFAEDWLEDMTASDEGIDLLYDLVS